jgi:hypothetical protein
MSVREIQVFLAWSYESDFRSGTGHIRNFNSRFPMKRAKYNTRIVLDEMAD